jgi:hypothetical protein
MKDYETSLFSGYKKEHNKLHIVLILWQINASNGWSDKGFNELLQFLNYLLPKANVLPRSTYQAKKIICPLGLEVEKIHACWNDCMLFRNEDAMLEESRVCGTSWYKQNNKNINEDDMGENKKVKRVPAKVAWYFPHNPSFTTIVREQSKCWVVAVAHERAQKRCNAFVIARNWLGQFGLRSGPRSRWALKTITIE